MVVFVIVIIVQFIVIIKGFECIVEVVVCFLFDVMSGKQMSIDVDLCVGVIDEVIVKEKCNDMENESQLYGFFDGVMKFIKGDVIVGIIIIFVNLIGGIFVGMV